MATDKIFASIITIGDELLIGQTIDTNSAWMGQQLNKVGIWVKRRVAVGDVKNEIWNALDEEGRQSDIIFITGGLGPTADDITKPLLCEYFGGSMIVNEEALQNVKTIFEKYINRPLLPSNLKQAEVPDVCTVIHNKRGTAPGMWFTHKNTGKIYISMPGVPNEMKGMMTDDVLPKLPSLFTLPAVVHRTLMTFGIGESFIAERIKDFESALPPHIKLAYLPNYGMVKLRLTATGKTIDAITKEVDDLFARLQKFVQDVLVTTDDRPLQEVIGQLLLQNSKTLSTAESCTGGYVAHLITAIPGASAYFKGGVVSYDNSIKHTLLAVNGDTLNTLGAVSNETVRQMAEGARTLMNTDFSIAISGIMGPDGGSEDKPVGTVWIAVAGSKETVAQKFQLRYNRTTNIEITANLALNMLRLALEAQI